MAYLIVIYFCFFRFRNDPCCSIDLLYISQASILSKFIFPMQLRVDYSGRMFALYTPHYWKTYSYYLKIISK